MAHPHIKNGVWKRNVTWKYGPKGLWRTDITPSTLVSVTAQEAEFNLRDGTVVKMEMAELRAALTDSPSRKDGKIIGPFNIDIENHEINSVPVNMNVIKPSLTRIINMWPAIPENIKKAILLIAAEYNPNNQ